MFKLWKLGLRDLQRNKRRSILTLIAVALGLALLITINGLIEGELTGTLENTIRLQTGHVQIREESYDEDKVSLKWEDLLNDAAGLAARAQALPGVKAATPILWASGILGARDDTTGVRYSALTRNPRPTRRQEAVVSGQFLSPDDRGGILIGQPLAKSLAWPRAQVSLLVNTSSELPDQTVFTIRGLFNTRLRFTTR
jgi:putative ABC transport system permease protein